MKRQVFVLALVIFSSLVAYAVEDDCPAPFKTTGDLVQEQVRVAVGEAANPPAGLMDMSEVSNARQILAAVATQPELKRLLERNPVISAYVYLKHIKKLDPNARGEMRLRVAQDMMKSYFAQRLGDNQIAQIDAAVEAAIARTPMAVSDQQISAALGVDDIISELNTAARRRAQVRLARWQQLTNLPRKSRELSGMLAEETGIEKFDERAFGLWGFSNLNHASGEQALRNYRARLYDQAPSAPAASDIQDLDPRELLAYMEVAMEIEAPIQGYSLESGETFFIWLDPSFAPFMGISPREYSWQMANNGGYCHSAWCHEEQRHERTWSMLLKALTGINHRTLVPNATDAAVPTLDGAFKHVISRMTTEIGASSTYLVIALHTQGGTRTHIMNLVRDELKHLAIATAGYTYLFGPRPMHRLRQILEMSSRFVSGHQENRSTGGAMGANPISNLLFGQSFAGIELATQRWVRTLPVRVVRRIMEESLLQRQPMGDVAPEIVAMEARLRATAREDRMNLVHWENATQRQEALAQLRFEDANEAALRRFIADRLDGFRGAEAHGSSASRRMRGVIDTYNFGSYPDLARLEPRRTANALLNLLREYQVFNNWYVMQNQEILAPAIRAAEQDLAARNLLQRTRPE